MRIPTSIAQIIILVIALSAPLANRGYAQGRWDTISSAGFTYRHGHASVVIGGKIYVIGGNTPDSLSRPITSINVYDPPTDTWTTPSTTGEFVHRRGFTAEVFNDKIYVFGGYSDSLSLIYPDIGVFDPSSSSWTTLTTSGDYFPRVDHSSAVVNGKIYMIGGAWEGGSYMYTTDVFDPETNNWVQPEESGEVIPRRGASAVTANGVIYVVGGFGPPGKYITSIDKFDPATNYWETLLTIGRPSSSIFQTSQLVNGKIYILGGYYGGNPVTKFKAYDPLTDSIPLVETTGKYTPRYSLSSCVLDGKLYVFGGITADSTLAPNEVFTPSNFTTHTAPINNDKISLHPNPKSGLLVIAGIPEGGYTIKIMNILGEQIMLKHRTTTDASLDITHLPTGSYFVQFTTKDSVETRLIVKQ
jgi:N-acetylneuraminic acid mutarotase